jgi:hypothetical protein
MEDRLETNEGEQPTVANVGDRAVLSSSLLKSQIWLEANPGKKVSETPFQK